MTGYKKVRRALCLFILFAALAAALATVAAPFEYGIKAPLLALASGLFILAGIIPVRLPEPEQILGLVATALGALAALFLFYLVVLACWAWILVTILRSRKKR